MVTRWVCWHCGPAEERTLTHGLTSRPSMAPKYPQTLHHITSSCHHANDWVRWEHQCDGAGYVSSSNYKAHHLLHSLPAHWGKSVDSRDGRTDDCQLTSAPSAWRISLYDFGFIKSSGLKTTCMNMNIAVRNKSWRLCNYISIYRFLRVHGQV